ncbi:aspartyl protease family protein At5g10770-like [Mangifera indica]|uniref:aspartyl protease family protein At5g10770-like n=1 Tax=Mangifera indica TaxID=29780 RepID=UPI001CF95C5D|nr:aspartyl protease family protein At5g10770-like [Mangifera indica]
MHSPRQSHFGIAKRVLRYVKGTTDHGLWFKSAKNGCLLGFSDSDWVGCVDDYKSTSGYMFTLGNGVFSWSSKKQEVVAQSSAEVKYIVAANAANHAVWLRKLLTDLSMLPSNATVIKVDNKSAIYMAQNPVLHGKSKHIKVKFHVLRQLEAEKEVHVEYCKPPICLYKATQKNKVCTFYHAEQPEAQLSYSRIVKVSSVLPPTVCNRNSTRVPSKASLEVVSRYGPCSYINKGKVKPLNYSEILLKDRARAKYIQSRLFKLKHSGSDDDLLKQKDYFTVGTKPDISAGASIEFYITASLGTPGQRVNLLLDTGSDITFTQCTPCLDCFKQKTPLFDPSKSSSFSVVPCRSCLSDFEPVCNKANQCIYRQSYGSGRSSGVVATEKLTIINRRSGTFVKYPYIFGCGRNNSLDFGMGGATGIIGLDRFPASFISQTSQKYFSYCFPSSYSSPGYITFGRTDDDKNYKFVKFTPIATSSTPSVYYDIIITGMVIAGEKLPVASSEYSKSGAIIDSGSTVTSLPPSVYAALRSAFRKKMSNYKMLKPGSIGDFDTCYDLSEYDEVVIPKISILFKGGVELELDVKGILLSYGKDLSLSCFAFQEGSGEPSLILGNSQTRGIEVHHDLIGQRVGFGPGGCS